MIIRILIILSIAFILHSCCSIDIPKFDEVVQKKQITMISNILKDNKYIEKITLDTALSTEYFYYSVNDTGLNAYISRMKDFDCETKFVSFETKAVKTHDSSFKIGNVYYFNKQKNINGSIVYDDLVFIFLNLNKKWYLDDIIVNKNKSHTPTETKTNNP